MSICIPLHNAERYIADTISRAQQQSYRNIEIIIVDDHSSDTSLTIARRFESKRVRIYESNERGGNAARNFAFEMSRGEYIKFLDADDYCSPNMIKAQMERLLQDGTHHTLAFSPVRMLYADREPQIIERSLDVDYTPAIELLYNILQGRGWNCPHSYLMHRDLVRLAGGWDETIVKNQDGEFFARIAAVADSALSIREEYAVWRQTGVGVSTQLSNAAHESVIRSYSTIAHLLLAYRNDSKTRRLCAERLGYYVYANYPSCEESMREIYRQLNWLGEPLRLPRRRILRVLTTLLGWQRALRLLHRLRI